MYRNQKGMSLVSVLIAIGLTGVLGTILMSLMEQQGKQTKKAMVDGEMTEVYAQFVRVIVQKSSCDSTFIGLQKGDPVTEFRYTFDYDQVPFAEVGSLFRGTKLKLFGMKILTNAEVIARNMTPVIKSPSGETVLVLEVTLERPEGVLGAKHIKKTFDINAVVGQGMLIKMADPNAIESACAQATTDGCIADFDSGLCTTPPQDAMIDGGAYWFGYCFDPTPANPANDIIVRCSPNT